jgi:autotransporter-associated beta strand protein
MGCRNSSFRDGLVVALGFVSAFLVFPVSPAAAQLTWTGSTNNNWSLASGDANWTAPGYFSDGNSVTFGNSGANTNINIVSTVQPGSVTFNNSSVPYSFSGAAISGTASVTLSTSAGNVTFNSPNSYTGGTLVNGGTLTAANDAALGSGTVSVGAAGTLNFTSATPTVNGL